MGVYDTIFLQISKEIFERFFRSLPERPEKIRLCSSPFFFYRSQSVPCWSWICHKLCVRGCNVFWDILYIQTFLSRHIYGDWISGIYIQILCFCIRYKPLACFARGDFSRWVHIFTLAVFQFSYYQIFNSVNQPLFATSLVRD